MQEKIKIPNSEGKNIAAVIHRPETQTEKLAILCPGYLDSKDYQGILKLAEALAERGFTAIRFDPLGTWESGDDINDYTMANYLACIRSVKEYMRTHGNYTFILLGGHSRGGRMSIIYTASDKDISSVLAIMPSAKSVSRNSVKETDIEGGKSRCAISPKIHHLFARI